MGACRFTAVALGVGCMALASACADPDPALPRTVADRCTTLVTHDLIDMRIVTAEMVPGDADAPTHCRVAGVIETEIHFELLLPEDWNGRLVMGGGEGFVGSVQNQAMAPMYAAVGGRRWPVASRLSEPILDTTGLESLATGP